MGSLNLSLDMRLDYTTCCTCGVPIICDAVHMTQLRKDHSTFYCINGHSQHFLGQTAADKLRKDLEREQMRRRSAEHESEYQKRRARAYKGKLTSVKKRVANGVCPCCKRGFKNLAAHMKTKHPNYGESETQD